MLLFALLIALLALAWGLADHQLSAPIRKAQAPPAAIVAPAAGANVQPADSPDGKVRDEEGAAVPAAASPPDPDPPTPAAGSR